MPTTRRPPRPGRAVAAAAALLLGVTGAVLWGVGGPDALRQVGGPFQLVDELARPVTDRSFRGRYMLVYFGYTTCPDICPVTLREMAAAIQALGPQGRAVQPVFVTLDPKRDTPAVLRAYVDAIGPGIVALTGPEASVDRLLRDYRVRRALHSVPGHPGDYLVDHSAVLYLMGPDGHFVAPVRANETGNQMAAEIAPHLSGA